MSADDQNPLLIVEDDLALQKQIKWSLDRFESVTACDRESALLQFRRHQPAVVTMDLGLPPDPDSVSEGFKLLEQMLAIDPNVKVIVLTGQNDQAHALRAVALGAYDFLAKPFDPDVLGLTVERGQRLAELQAENRRLQALHQPDALAALMTRDPEMMRIARMVERVASSNATVLLLGESGTGKEALAHALHDLGPRARAPFIAINCGAIPENLLESELFGYERGAFTGAVKQTIGKIEAANKGTLFLDEIGDLPFPLQVKLLRFLQEQVIERVGGRQSIPVDVRVVSATNMQIEEQVAGGRFRNDLYYRLNSVTVRIPPLRERPGDAGLLARFFLARFNHEFGRNMRGFADTAMAAINAHAWPGNVRELENRMKRAVVMSEGRLIEATDLELAPVEPEDGDLNLRAARTRAELEVLQKAIGRSRGRLTHAAKLLGISRPTLYTLLEAHGLSVESVTSALPDPDLPVPGAGPGASPGGPNTGPRGDNVPLHNLD